jgi:hypothetical protein
MGDKHVIIEKILRTFESNEFPGENFLQGSFDGSEPYDEIEPFRSKKDWRAIEASFLDAHYSALSFFSEASFRFFLPAYLIADLNDQLKTADPVFHLTHGFFETAVSTTVGERAFTLRSGKTTFINPKRFGAATFYDYACYRLSIFTREEAGAIVAYLEFRRDRNETVLIKEEVDAALKLFWLERAQTAPPAESLRQHIAEQEQYIAAIQT